MTQHPLPPVIAIIPARGGSRGVPGKNLARVGGVPLIQRTIRAAQGAASIGLVVVSTDDTAIADAATAAGAHVVVRPAELAGDTASSESALVHALDALGADPDILVFLQATSPFLDPADLDAAIERVRAGERDVVFSAIASHAFLWAEGVGGAVGVNHDASVRQRRQDREAEFRETGAFYVMRADGFRERGHRFFGRIGIAVVPELSALEIDTPDDLELARAMAPLLDRPGAIEVDAVVTDFDGVHTDDRVHVGADGTEFVTASRSDGMGVELLRQAGVPVLVLSKERHPVVAARAAKLSVEALQGVDDKAAALLAWARAHGVDLARTAYLGNDVNDLPCFDLVGWPIAVADAHPTVLRAARVVLRRPGGWGAVRELADRILTTNPPAQRTQEESWSPSAHTR